MRIGKRPTGKGPACKKGQALRKERGGGETEKRTKLGRRGLSHHTKSSCPGRAEEKQ